VPTTFPKCNPTEMMGLLVLLNSHKGSEDVALLADDLDLEIDEILPSVEFAEVLQLVKVVDGRATFTDLGRKVVNGSIRDRKTIIREQLRNTTLFRTLLRALENAPDHSLTDEDLAQIVAFTTSPEEAVRNIVTWGRYADLFRYDSEDHRLVLNRKLSGGKTGPGPALHPPGSTGVSVPASETPGKSSSPSSSHTDLRTTGVETVAI
jgi:NitT/TauT family transport system ATP-binding protein